jgi:hypothetical protein
VVEKIPMIKSGYTNCVNLYLKLPIPLQKKKRKKEKIPPQISLVCGMKFLLFGYNVNYI